MVLLDSDIVIYSTKPGYDLLRGFLSERSLSVSVATRVEVLGFHAITEIDKVELEALFQITAVLPITDEIAEKSIELRQIKKMSLGDAFIAATAIVENIPLVTNNTKDFKWITSLTLIDPFEDTAPS